MPMSAAHHSSRGPLTLSAHFASPARRSAPQLLASRARRSLRTLFAAAPPPRRRDERCQAGPLAPPPAVPPGPLLPGLFVRPPAPGLPASRDPGLHPAGASPAALPQRPLPPLPFPAALHSSAGNHDPVASAPAAWWSPSREEKARDGSPVDGIVHQQQSPTTASGQQSQQQQQVVLITPPPPREVARPEMPRDSVPAALRVDEEEWVTVFGFLPGDTNLVLREFEKCGIVLRHVPGPRDANWMHILYQVAWRMLEVNGKRPGLRLGRRDDAVK